VDWNEFESHFCSPGVVSLSVIVANIVRAVDAVNRYRITAIRSESLEKQVRAHAVLAVKIARLELSCFVYDQCTIPVEKYSLRSLVQTAYQNSSNWTVVVGCARAVVAISKSCYFIGNVDNVFETALKDGFCCE